MILGVGRVGLAGLVDARLLGPLDLAEAPGRAGESSAVLQPAASLAGE